MQIANFLQDLAIIMIVAGIVTIIFHQLKQPVVLGYILSGVIIGRHTPPFAFLQDENTVKTLAELGVIFLMFSLGLEFSIRKLLRVSAAALISATAEIILMIIVGYSLGKFFGWKPMDSLFLGAMLAISSTTIIVKALNELGKKNENFAQMIFGILIVEDILAIAILAILSSFALSGSFDMTDFIVTIGKLFVFFIASLVIGIFFVPKLLSYVDRFKSKEMLLIVVLALCFGFSFLVIKLGYSIALGAFLIGAIMAESQEIKVIEKLVEPLTNMFSAIFFVSIGLLVDPKIIHLYLIPITIITIALVIGKVFICSFGVFISGQNARTSMRVGMGLAQIGEFSFIIASLGISLNVMSPYLYPIIVAVSAITTFLTPYLIKSADPFTLFLARIIPSSISQIFNTYTKWIKNLISQDEPAPIKEAIKKSLFQIFINLILVIAIFIVSSYVSHNMNFHKILFNDIKIDNAIIWGISLVISLPFLIASYRKLKALSLIIAELGIKKGKDNTKLHPAIAKIVLFASILGIILMIILLSVSILPPFGLLILVLGIVIIITAMLWPWFIKLHSKMQIGFINTFKKKDKR
ncbi:MAG TPA: cation:proton antiporter [Gammaproteobacteria bacterium]|nr:cation:proton antiporter [Gammaproteobacteria bacterium]